MDVTLWCTDTVMGALLMPAAVAVTVAVPVRAAPDGAFPLQTTKVESHTPPQTTPEGEIVTRFGFVELKVNVVATGWAAEFSAVTESCATCPETTETVAGLRFTTATVFLLDELPPQPAMAKPRRASSRVRANDDFMQSLKLISGGKTIIQSRF
jgi:hypothetical protein